MTAAPLLLVSGDEAVVTAVGRLAAAAGIEMVVEPEVRPGPWVSAPAVVVGADAAASVARARPARRDLLHVVSAGPAADTLFRHALALGACAVVELPDGAPSLAGVIADLGDEVDGGGTVVGVVGGSGGAGASTLAAAAALRAGAGGAVALLDLDPLGPGLRRLLGQAVAPLRSSGSPAAERAVTWPELGSSQGRLGARELRSALRPCDGVGVLGWDRSDPRDAPGPAVLHEVVSASRRGHHWVLLDVPRHAAGDLAAGGVCDRWVVVARPSVAPVASAAVVVGLLRTAGADVRAVVRGGEPETVSRLLDVPLLAPLREHRRLEEHLDLGLGPVHGRRNPLRAAADLVLRGLQPRSVP